MFAERFSCYIRTHFSLVLTLSVLVRVSFAAPTVSLEQVGRWSRSNTDVLHVEVYGSHLYVGTFSSGWNVVDVSDPTAPLTLQTNGGGPEKEIWGMKVLEGVLVVTHGATATRHDLSDPSAPVFIDRSSGMFGTYTRDPEFFGSTLIPGDLGLTRYRPGTAVTTKVFNGQIYDMQAYGGYLYTIGNGFKVLQESGAMLAAPSSVAINGTGIRVADQTALVVASGGLRLYDLGNPAKPSFITNAFTGTGMEKLELAGIYAYVTSGAAGVRVVDWSDRAKPKIAGSFNTAGACQDLCVSGDYIFVADGQNGVVILKQTVAEGPMLTIVSAPPPSVVLNTGETLTLAVEASSSAPITYRWFAAELPLSETSHSLTIPDVNRSHAGVYSVEVTDGTSTETFQVSVRVVGNLQLTLVPTTVPPMLIVSDPLGMVQQSDVVLETSTDLIEWTPLTDVWIDGTAAAVANNLAESARYYRAAEAR